MEKSNPETIPVCPICGKKEVAEYRPFCSKRCSDIDLHRWFAGVYAIPADEEAPLNQNGEE